MARPGRRGAPRRGRRDKSAQDRRGRVADVGRHAGGDAGHRPRRDCERGGPRRGRTTEPTRYVEVGADPGHFEAGPEARWQRPRRPRWDRIGGPAPGSCPSTLFPHRRKWTRRSFRDDGGRFRNCGTAFWGGREGGERRTSGVSGSSPQRSAHPSDEHRGSGRKTSGIEAVGIPRASRPRNPSRTCSVSADSDHPPRAADDPGGESIETGRAQAANVRSVDAVSSAVVVVWWLPPTTGAS